MTATTTPYLLFQAAAFAGALGQLFYKLGADGKTVARTQRAVFLLVGMGLYISVLALFTAAYRLGGEVSSLYPTYGVTFAWGIVLARVVLGEPLTLAKAAGCALVIGGLYVVTL